MTWVKEGGMVRLDKKYLQADFKGVATDDIVYTILPSDGQPKYGTNTFTQIQSEHFVPPLYVSLTSPPSSPSR